MQVGPSSPASWAATSRAWCAVQNGWSVWMGTATARTPARRAAGVEPPRAWWTLKQFRAVATRYGKRGRI